MGPAGEIYIRNEIDDTPYVESHRKVFEKPNDKHGGPLGPEAPGAPPGGRTHTTGRNKK